MNEITYIQQHGVEKAREVVEGASFGTHYRVDTGKFICCHNEDHFYFVDQVRLGVEFVRIVELKHLVESADLVGLLGGIKSLKGLVDISNSPFALSHITREGVIYSMDEIKQAIAEYEAIGGEHV